MEIDRDFTLYGFERKYLGEGGVAFYRYGTPKNKNLECSVREENYYSGYEYSVFRVQIPKPQARILTGSVLIIRNSKNRYKFCMENDKQVTFGDAITLKEIREQVDAFFKEKKR